MTRLEGVPSDIALLWVNLHFDLMLGLIFNDLTELDHWYLLFVPCVLTFI